MMTPEQSENVEEHSVYDEEQQPFIVACPSNVYYPLINVTAGAQFKLVFDANTNLYLTDVWRVP